ncbi:MULTISPECIES: flippase [Alcaligenes]|uniref:flippase n=1 Tax=Alcaligenes TaxID=507 RepID=UPI00030790B9|nr:MULTISPECIES: flippase [Alcaligenes]HRO20447.1 flippase [Alcaligenes phenolicus]HRP14142.1 flippase [Alcaligenes phenolicus]
MSAKKLLGNSFWNLSSYMVLMFAFLPSMGMMARILGLEPFGIYTLLFALIGYASMFDLGISRALIRAIAMADKQTQQIQSILGTATLLILFSSGVAAALVFLFSPLLVQWLNISPGLRADSLFAFRLMALSLPFLLLQAVWLSYLEGLSDFKQVNIQRTLSGLLLAILPLLAILYQASLSFAVLGLFVGRLFTCVLAYFWALPTSLRKGLWHWDRQQAHGLLRFGGWLTVSNVISPLMVYFDRFLLSNLNGATTVSFYTAPAEAITRLLNIPGAVVRVIFPLISAQKDTRQETRLTYLLLLGVCGLISLAGIVGAKWLILLWLGEAYVEQSVPLLQILLVGFFFNAIAQIPYTVIQAKGHAHITAYVHLAEILPYIALLYVLISHLGLLGAAIAWTSRVIVDCLALLILANRYR